jgi:hypothetical protein
MTPELAGKGGARAGFLKTAQRNVVRRPLLGIQPKPDTYASLTVYGPGVDISLANSSEKPGSSTNATTNFILQSVQEARAEKFQQLPTFGDTYGFFFGEQPRMIHCSAILLNTADFPWQTEWWHNYENHLRGTRLVDRQVKAYLKFDDTTVEGYLIGANTSNSANAPYEVPLNFSMWVTGVEYDRSPAGEDWRLRPYDDLTEGEYTYLDADFGRVRDDLANKGWLDTDQELQAKNQSDLVKKGTAILKSVGNAVNAVKNFTGKVGQQVRNITTALYGQKMVIPEGYYGTEAVQIPTRIVFPGDDGEIILPWDALPFYNTASEYIVRHDKDALFTDLSTIPEREEPLAGEKAKRSWLKAGLDIALVGTVAVASVTRKLTGIGFGICSAAELYKARKDIDFGSARLEGYQSEARNNPVV